MTSDRPARRLRDIIENAQAIFRYTSGMDVGAFEADQKNRDAVERCLRVGSVWRERSSCGYTQYGSQASTWRLMAYTAFGTHLSCGVLGFVIAVDMNATINNGY